MGYNIHEHKRYYCTFDNLAITIIESIQNISHKSFHAKS